MIATQQDTRRFTRIDYRHPVQYRDAAGALGEGTLNNVSYGGTNVTMGRYLKPNTLVYILAPACEKSLTFPARVAWCAPDRASETFRAGLQADHRARHTMAVLSSWMLEAFRERPAEVY